MERGIKFKDKADLKLYILIDSFREDYLDYTPFLKQLSKHNLASTLPTLGYSLTVLTTIFTGTYPEENGVWLRYYRSDNSPFKYLKAPSIVDKSKVMRYLFNAAIGFWLRKTGRIPRHIPVNNIPLQLVRYFNFSDKKVIFAENPLGRIKTLYDLLRENGIRFKHYGSPYTDEEIEHLEEKINFIYFGTLDGITHKFGINSAEQKEYLGILDKKIQKLFAKYNISDFIIFSDHAMNKVEHYFNVDKFLKDFHLGKDYIYFLDATMARFWLLSEKGRGIEDILKTREEGKVLTTEDKKRYGINFNDNRYGDIIFVAKKGYYLQPNFYSVLGGRVEATHGYLPEEEKGFLISNFNTKGEVTAGEIFSMMKKSIGLD